MREIGVFADTVVKRSQDAADRAGVNASISMAAYATIDRAGIEAGPAANALQALAEWRGENFRPAVVQKDKMKFLRAVRLAGTARTGNEGRVHRQGLPRGCTGQQF